MVGATLVAALCRSVVRRLTAKKQIYEAARLQERIKLGDGWRAASDKSPPPSHASNTDRAEREVRSSTGFPIAIVALLHCSSRSLTREPTSIFDPHYFTRRGIITHIESKCSAYIYSVYHCKRCTIAAMMPALICRIHLAQELFLLMSLERIWRALLVLQSRSKPQVLHFEGLSWTVKANSTCVFSQYLGYEVILIQVDSIIRKPVIAYQRWLENKSCWDLSKFEGTINRICRAKVSRHFLVQVLTPQTNQSSSSVSLPNEEMETKRIEQSFQSDIEKSSSNRYSLVILVTLHHHRTDLQMHCLDCKQRLHHDPSFLDICLCRPCMLHNWHLDSSVKLGCFLWCTRVALWAESAFNKIDDLDRIECNNRFVTKSLSSLSMARNSLLLLPSSCLMPFLWFGRCLTRLIQPIFAEHRMKVYLGKLGNSLSWQWYRVSHIPVYQPV